MMTTIHAYTSSQHLLDGYSKKSKRLGEWEPVPMVQSGIAGDAVADAGDDLPHHPQAEVSVPTSFLPPPVQPRQLL